MLCKFSTFAAAEIDEMVLAEWRTNFKRVDRTP